MVGVFGSGGDKSSSTSLLFWFFFLLSSLCIVLVLKFSLTLFLTCLLLISHNLSSSKKVRVKLVMYITFSSFSSAHAIVMRPPSDHYLFYQPIKPLLHPSTSFDPTCGCPVTTDKGKKTNNTPSFSLFLFALFFCLFPLHSPLLLSLSLLRLLDRSLFLDLSVFPFFSNSRLQWQYPHTL